MPAQRKVEAPAVERLCYRISDASRAIGVGRTTIYHLIREGKLTLIKIGGRSLVTATSLHELIRTSR
jgi:excisionase family DNA binding protein